MGLNSKSRSNIYQFSMLTFLLGTDSFFVQEMDPEIQLKEMH